MRRTLFTRSSTITVVSCSLAWSPPPDASRDACALILPDVLLPRRQTAQRRPRGAQLCFGAFGLRDVAVCAQRAVLAAELEAHEREQSGTWWTVSRLHLELDIVDDAGLAKHVDDLGAPRGVDEAEFDRGAPDDFIPRPLHQMNERLIRIQHHAVRQPRDQQRQGIRVERFTKPLF